MHVVALQTAGDFLSEHLVQGTDTLVLEHFEKRLYLRIDDHVHYRLGHHLCLVSGKVVDHHLPLLVEYEITCQGENVSTKQFSTKMFPEGYLFNYL